MSDAVKTPPATATPERAMFKSLQTAEQEDCYYAENYADIEEAAKPLFNIDERLLPEVILPGSSMLDAMCGPGRHLLLLGKRGVAVTGNDYNPHMLEQARQNLAESGVAAELTHSDVVAGMPFADGTFDFTISMFHSLGTIPEQEDRQRAVAEMARVTRPGGSVLIHGHNLLANLYKEKYVEWTIPNLVQPPPGHEIGDLRVNGYGNDLHRRQPSFAHIHLPWELLGYLPRAGLTITHVYFLDYGTETYQAVRYDPADTASMTAVGHGFYQADGIIVAGQRG
jgi:SAM-dependent methyltransferase